MSKDSGNYKMEKLCLTWTTYESSMISTLKNLMTNDSSKDVTLVSDDGSQFRAHKFILTSSSLFFQNIFNKIDKNKQFLQPIIFLSNVRSSMLDSILKFIYLGQVFLEQCDLKEFLRVAEILKVVGLSELYSRNKEESDPLMPGQVKEVNDESMNAREVKEAKQVEECTKYDYQKPQPTPIKVLSASSVNEKAAAAAATMFDPIELLQEQTRNIVYDPVQEFIDGLMMIKHENPDTPPIIPSSLTPPPEDFDLDFNTPTTVKSTTDASVQSLNQDDVERSSPGTQVAVNTPQKMYKCEKCDYKSAKLFNVKKHTASIHDGIRYPCQFCDYKATETGHLRKHLRNVHKKLLPNPSN